MAFVAAPDNLNLGFPTGLANDPLNLGAGPIEPASDPFSPLNVNSYTDPHLKAGYSDQWNFGFQKELAPGATATVNYVGSRNARIATNITANAAPSPGPGDPQLMGAVLLHSAHELHRECWKRKLQRSSSLLSGADAFRYRATFAYTWSKTMVTGCDGLFCRLRHPGPLQPEPRPRTRRPRPYSYFLCQLCSSAALWRRKTVQHLEQPGESHYRQLAIERNRSVEQRTTLRRADRSIHLQIPITFTGQSEPIWLEIHTQTGQRPLL